MVERYKAGTSITVEIPFRSENGTPVDVESLSYKVFDENGDEVIAKTVISVEPDDTYVNITVPALSNTIPEGSTRAMREVELSMTSPTGAILTSSVRYVLEESTALTFGINSFMSLNEAIMVGLDLADIQDWDTAVDSARESALIEAYHKIGTLVINAEGAMNRLIYGTVSYVKLDELSATELSALDSKLLAALKRAQVIQANYLLGGDPIEQTIKAGMKSQMVGQSIDTFASRPVHFAVCNRALRELTGYVSFTKRVGRG